MTRALVAATVALLLSVTRPAFGHRVDEYLQATTIAVEKERVVVQLRLAPGIEVFPKVLALVDADRDGAITEAELRAYAERLVGELTLSVDGSRLPLRLVSARMEPLEALKDGRGTIEIAFDAAVPHGDVDRRVVFENHHQRAIAEYLVNGLVPSDSSIRLGAQQRSEDQSVYRLDYVQRSAASAPSAIPRTPGIFGWLAAVTLLLIARLASARRRAGEAVRAH
jgi:hypothetical protein